MSHYLRKFVHSTVLSRRIPWTRLSVQTFSQSPNEDGHNEDGHHQRRHRHMFGLGGATLLGVASAWLWSSNRRQNVVHAASVFGGGDGGVLSHRKQFNFIADVVDQAAPSLVYIEIKDVGVTDFMSGYPTTSSNGSGFIVSDDGLILTNAHVVINKPRAQVQVRLQDGREYVGKVEDVDVRSDLATVRIPVKDLPVMKLGNSSDIRPGEFVIAMGSPLSLSNTITFGVVSTKSRQKAELGLRGRDIPEYIQTDAAITFGNSGGPLVNLDGEAIGINSMKVTPGISFAIPIDYAKDFLKRSAETQKSGGWPEGSKKRKFLGITMLTLNPQIIEELRTRMELPSDLLNGILVFRIVKGSPADRHGIKPGDIITQVNEVPIHGSRDVYRVLEETDGPMDVKVFRKGKYSIVKILAES